jgi:hypothetical protein
MPGREVGAWGTGFIQSLSYGLFILEGLLYYLSTMFVVVEGGRGKNPSVMGRMTAYLQFSLE